MATVTVRNLDADVTDGLKALGHAHGRSMEAEARAILTSAVVQNRSQVGLGSRIRARFAQFDLDLEVRRNSDGMRPAEFEE